MRTTSTDEMPIWITCGSFRFDAHLRDPTRVARRNVINLRGINNLEQLRVSFSKYLGFCQKNERDL